MKVGGESYATAAPGAPLENRRIGLLPEEADLVAAELDQLVQYPAGLGASTDPAEILSGLSC